MRSLVKAGPMGDGIARYLNDYFDALSIDADEMSGHSFKAYLHQSMVEFLENENKEHAFEVYLNFFDTYKISLGNQGNQFLDLLDMMRSYEENASTLTAKQRDHYIHSVNVFLLGLCIYGANQRFRTCFEKSITQEPSCSRAHKTVEEEFFYRWGIASLFHDIGYPVEIISKQANQYLNYVVEAVYEEGQSAENHMIRVFLDYEDFTRFNRLPNAGSLEEFCAAFSVQNKTCDLFDETNPTDLLAFSIAKSYNLDSSLLKRKLDGFVADMQKYGFVDHGFYSAVIVLQWFAYLMQQTNHDPRYFFTTITDCAGAILLHNYYGNVLQRTPFNLGCMNPNDHPLAYLLVLCDELQEWNREAYGYEDKGRVAAERSTICISEDAFRAVYVSDESLLGDEFERNKKALLHKRLDIEAIFPQSFEVDSVNADSALGRIYRTFGTVPPIARPLLGQLEDIAKEIHELYRLDQIKRQRSDAPEMRKWDDLPEDIKYSNLAQARHIVDKLRLIGCGITSKEPNGEVLSELKQDEIEYLSIVEHNRWVEERLSNGWVYGKEKNTTAKTSPYLLAWDALTEDVKELDRNAVRNIIPLLDTVGLGVYRAT